MNKNIITKINEFKSINEALDLEYTRWKRKNVTLRGISDRQATDNKGMAKYGSGLYTAFLGNKDMAKQYGDVYFVVNAIPKNPKILNSVNNAEIFLQELKRKYLENNNMQSNRAYFDENTTIADEMMNNGYDGLIIKPREMVNYKPENVLYFRTENELYNYFKHSKLY